MGIYTMCSREEKINELLNMNEENDLMYEIDDSNPSVFNVEELRHSSDADRNAFLKECISFESGETPPKYVWEQDPDHTKFIPKGSIRTRKDAESFLDGLN
jgi:hypothetical protein